MKKSHLLAIAVALATGLGSAQAGAVPLEQRLAALPYKIVYETYTRNNWELFAMHADGRHKINLTHTPNENEHYPQVSPDGTKIAFVADRGEGREAIRSLYYMNADGSHRVKIADYARQPFWSPDSRTIGYLPQEFPKFDVIDYYTKGMMFYHVDTGKTEAHPNTANLHHLYNPSFSANGKWIAATVHAGMGYSHTILLIEAHGSRIINLEIPGCRPCLSPDGKMIAWGSGDHELDTADLDAAAPDPKVGRKHVRILDAQNKIYHIDWSPDSRFVAFSRGPDGEGDVSKPCTFTAACEIVGVYAPGWNICAAAADADAVIDLSHPDPSQFATLTDDGNSNKEPAWYRLVRRFGSEEPARTLRAAGN